LGPKECKKREGREKERKKKTHLISSIHIKLHTKHVESNTFGDIYPMLILKSGKLK